ncbi:MAG: GAF domain-containing protein, partial [Dehalococcoidia bacterium]
MRDGLMKVLLVEDNPADARLVREMLAEAGETEFHLSHVGRLDEALASLAQDRFDVILLDLSLPDGYGLDTVVQIAAAAPSLPIVVMSGLSDEGLAISAVQEGAQDYLIKGRVDGGLLVRSIRYATERQRAEVEIRERSQGLEVLHRVSQAVSQSLDLEAVSALALGEALRVLGLDAGTIRHLDEAAQDLVVLSHQGMARELVSEIQSRPRREPGRGLAGIVMATGKPLVVEDLPHDPRTFYSVAPESFMSYVGIPLRVRDRVVGLIVGLSLRRRTFTPADLEMMASLGNMVGMAMANARLFEEQKRRTEELAALHQVGQAVSQSLDLEAVSSLALREALGVLGLDAGSIRNLDEASGELVLLCQQGIPREMARHIKPRVRVGQGLPGIAVQTGEPLVVEDLLHDSRSTVPHARRSGFQSAVYLPLRVRDRVVGVITGYSRPRRSFTPAEVGMMASLGNMVGMAFTNAHLYGQVETAGREWEQTFGAMGDGVAILSPELRILRANPAMARMLDTTPEALVGRYCYEAIHGREEPIAECCAVRGRDEGGPNDLMMQEAHLGNHWIHLRSDPVRDPQGRVLSLVHIMRDVTARREMEEEREQLLAAYREQSEVIASSYLDLEKAMARVQQAESKLQELYKQERGLRQELEAEIKRRAEFTRALVHELKTPLTPVLASSDLLLEELHEEPFLSLARNINQGASNLNNRIDELLDLSRGEIGMLRLNPRQVDPLGLLQQAGDHMAPVASGHGQSLILALPATLPLVWADEGRLRQVVLNLLGNASKFAPEGSEITLRARGEGDFLVVEVQDTGYGID